MTCRRIAMLYLPTVGLWALVRAIQFYRVPTRTSRLDRLTRRR